MKKIMFLIFSVFIVFISMTITALIYSINNGKLDNFNFIKVNNIGLNFYAYYEKVDSAINYEVIVYDKSDKAIFKKNTEETSITIELNKLINGDTYKIIVIAIDKNGNRKSIKEPYTFLWDELTFDSGEVLLKNDEDYIVKFIGNYNKKKYKLRIKDNDKVVDEVSIKGNEYKIKNDIFKDKSTTLKLEILDSSIVIDTLELFNNKSPISDINFVHPSNGDMLDYGDITLTFSGGDNASNYLIEIYNGNKLIRRKEISDKSIVLASNLFDKSATYKAKITASYYDYIDYSKTKEVTFTINSKETLRPVYTNYNYKMIKKGTKIKLLTPDDDATIYYTLDGSDPTTNGIPYKDEIAILTDTVVKTVSKAKNKNDSIVSTYEFKIGEKEQYKVYLSPSNQYANLGVKEVGYTTEKKEMNDLSDYIQKRLESYGVKVYRNGAGGIDRWAKDSNYLGVDLHLAIHSNASEDHKAYGIETWIHKDESPTYSLAQKIQSNLMDIYYNKEDKIANRGVKYAQGSLAEVNPSYVPFGILVEVAHHDYLEDAKWIMENKEKIGNNIADSVLEYFQIK